MATRHALEGIKVVDFSWYGTGPLIAKYLAEHGAEVIKVESNTRPDNFRWIGPFRDNKPGINLAGGWNNFNCGKMSITLNLDNPGGLELAKRLIARADIVIEGYTPRVMKKLGLNYERVKEVQPDIIMFSCPTQGQTGPDAERPGFGSVLPALIGVYNLVGWPDRNPCITGIAYTDYFCPYLGAVAVMAALDYRRRTGKGQYIDFSQFEATIHCEEAAVLDYTVNGRALARMGNRLPYHTAAPHGAYRCQGEDRWCAIAVFTDEEWRSFCQAIGDPDWTRDQKFATMMGRKENEDELDRLVQEWTINYSAKQVMTMMQAAGVAAGVVQTIEDVYRDPQLKHRHHYWEQDHLEAGKFIADASAFKLSKTPGEMSRPSPLQGQHNEYVSKELLGMSEEEFSECLVAGAID